MRGKVTRYYEDKKYGFIKSGEEDYFFHYTGIKKDGYKTIDDGVEVTFDVTKGRKGDIAINVEEIK